MAGMLIFLKVDPECSGPASVEGSVPLELLPSSRARDIIAKLREMNALEGGVKVEWQGAFLEAAQPLADVGLGAQCTARIAPLTEEEEEPLGKELCEAAYRGDKEAVEHLLGQGTDPSWVNRNEHDYTPLLRAAEKEHVEIARLLLDKGANIHARAMYPPRGATSLHYAVKRGHLEMVQLLLDRGADHAADHCGDTPLHHAVSHGHLNVARLLCERGATLYMESKDKRGETPLDIARRRRAMEMIQFLTEQQPEVQGGQ